MSIAKMQADEHVLNNKISIKLLCYIRLTELYCLQFGNTKPLAVMLRRPFYKTNHLLGSLLFLKFV